MRNLLILSAVFGFACAREFQFLNNLPYEIWVGILGNAGRAPLANGGFALQPGERRNEVWSDDDWAGRFWARTGCNYDTGYCETGDCGSRLECAGAGGVPPVSLAEITLLGWGDLDYYDISNVDGTNVPISLTPLGASGDGSQYSCTVASCPYNMNADCPAELSVLSPSGGVIACASACLAFNTDYYCCRGDCCGTPEGCNPVNWPVNYNEFFKSRCPGAYSYAYDDTSSTYTCTAPAYLITFG